MDDIKIIGYFVDKNGDKTSASDVFIAIDEVWDFNGGDITVYCPIGQHSGGCRDYLDDCEEITKEEYIMASKGIYTPIEYV